MTMQQENMVSAKKGRGRPAIGKGTQIQTRLQPDQLLALDTWIDLQEDSPTRPEAIRRILTEALRW